MQEDSAATSHHTHRGEDKSLVATVVVLAFLFVAFGVTAAWVGLLLAHGAHAAWMLFERIAG